MAIDTPARLAVLGAGPVGLEAALYARFLGYDVVVFERGELAAGVRAWAQESMFSPFGENRTTLGVAAIEAQDEAYRPPDDGTVLTGKEWIERYLVPLAATDLVSDHLRLHTAVVEVCKLEAEQDSETSEEEDGSEGQFRVRSRTDQGVEHEELFEGLLDCTGASGNTERIALLGSEPNCFFLGHRSSGQQDALSMAEAYEQIRDVFKIIGDREGLDLYASARKLVRSQGG